MEKRKPSTKLSSTSRVHFSLTRCRETSHSFPILSPISFSSLQFYTIWKCNQFTVYSLGLGKLKINQISEKKLFFWFDCVRHDWSGHFSECKRSDKEVGHNWPLCISSSSSLCIIIITIIKKYFVLWGVKWLIDWLTNRETNRLKCLSYSHLTRPSRSS